MFTGIIEKVGTIVDARPQPGGLRLCVEVGSIAQHVVLGASLSVNGVCLTVARIDATRLEFDVIRETLDRTSLHSKRAGDRVNIERSLRAGDPIDGHFVQGHVDGTAGVESVVSNRMEWLLWLRPQAHLVPYVVPKGAIALDGVSLTIAQTRGQLFSVALIPTTLERTTLSSLRAADVVNLETDILTRTVIHHLRSAVPASGLTYESLREAGYA